MSQLVTDIRSVIYFAILVFLRLFAIPITDKVIPLQKSRKNPVLLVSNPFKFNQSYAVIEPYFYKNSKKCKPSVIKKLKGFAKRVKNN